MAESSPFLPPGGLADLASVNAESGVTVGEPPDEPPVDVPPVG